MSEQTRAARDLAEIAVELAADTHDRQAIVMIRRAVSALAAAIEQLEEGVER